MTEIIVKLDFITIKTVCSGGTVDKNSPGNAGDTGSIPGPGRFHIPQSNYSPQATTTEPEYCNY